MPFRLLLAALLTVATAHVAVAQNSNSKYEVVDNWAQFPEGVKAWSAATGVDIDARSGNIYVFHRNESMPIMAFDKNGKFLRAWGQGLRSEDTRLNSSHSQISYAVFCLK